jgi:hypothetical protein
MLTGFIFGLDTVAADPLCPPFIRRGIDEQTYKLQERSLRWNGSIPMPGFMMKGMDGKVVSWMVEAAARTSVPAGRKQGFHSPRHRDPGRGYQAKDGQIGQTAGMSRSRMAKVPRLL